MLSAGRRNPAVTPTNASYPGDTSRDAKNPCAIRGTSRHSSQGKADRETNIERRVGRRDVVWIAFGLCDIRYACQLEFGWIQVDGAWSELVVLDIRLQLHAGWSACYVLARRSVPQFRQLPASAVTLPSLVVRIDRPSPGAVRGFAFLLERLVQSCCEGD